MHISQGCAHCSNDIRCRRRDFSEQAWAALVVWGEVERNTVDQPVCDDCYSDLRDILIDRADEMVAAASQPIPKSMPTKTAADRKKKVAKKKAKRTSKVA